jgi:hypothetical protein
MVSETSAVVVTFQTFFQSLPVTRNVRAECPPGWPRDITRDDLGDNLAPAQSGSEPRSSNDHG